MDTKMATEPNITLVTDAEAAHVWRPIKRDGVTECQHCDRPRQDRIHILSPTECASRLAIIHSMRLEQKGMRRRGRSATSVARQLTGLKTRDRSKLEAALREEIEASLVAVAEIQAADAPQH